ncbi:MAG: hypothetical protein JWM02_621 [Frankiales bacterium]|nr:hypothetical protein [Frankiales bacterium]
MVESRPLHWREHLERQDQVLSRHQAVTSGMTPEAWDWKLTRGLWTRVLNGVAVAHSGTPTDHQRSWAAVLHGGQGTALSGDAALLELGFTLKVLAAVDLAVPSGRRVVGARLTAGPLLVAHRVAGLSQWVRPVHGLPLLTAHAAVLHAAAWATSDRDAEWRLAAVVQQRISAVPLLRQTLEQMPRLPRRALIREVLDDVEFGAHAGSELEFLRFCRRNGLPLPDQMQVRVRAGKVRYLDVRYLRQRVALEIDGTHHREVAHWDADALRSLHLAVAARGTGEQLLRITRANMRHDEPVVAELLRTLLT